ncbi:MAG: lysophospholipid acyltransferase family protein, partial [Candidatus Binatia bacterium]
MAKRKGIWDREFFYRLRYRAGEWCLRGFVGASPWIPSRFLAAFTEFASRLTYFVLWDYRRRMGENLSNVMSEELPTAEDRKEMVRKAWRNFARGMYEITSAVHSSREEIGAMVAVEGEEHLARALAKGKGVVALSAHLGNFAMIGARLAAAGYPFSVVVKQPRDSRLAHLIDEYRARVGIKTISARPRRETARRILRALRQNEIVLLIADEFKSAGVRVEFFGRSALAPRGPATLALRTGAA